MPWILREVVKPWVQRFLEFWSLNFEENNVNLWLSSLVCASYYVLYVKVPVHVLVKHGKHAHVSPSVRHLSLAASTLFNKLHAFSQEGGILVVEWQPHQKTSARCLQIHVGLETGRARQDLDDVTKLRGFQTW